MTNRRFELTVDELVKLMENKSLKHNFEDIQTLAGKLLSDCVKGIDTDEDDINTRLQFYGSNYIAPKEADSFFYYLWKSLQDTILILLIVAAFVMLIIGAITDPAHGWIEGVAILFAVLVVSIVTATNDYQKELQFTKLQKQIKLSNMVVVIRKGELVELKASELLVGDLLVIKYGDQISADCILVSGSDLKVDESSLTGESDLVSKYPDTNPYLYSGTNVMQGNGSAIIVAVGLNSQSGKVFKLLGVSDKKVIKKNSEQEEHLDGEEEAVEFNKTTSVLQNKLTKLALIIGKIGLAVGIIVSIILLLRYVFTNYIGPNKRSFERSDLLQYLNFIVIGISIMIVAIPEGLPLAVTLSLAFSVYRMLKDNNLVRHLYSCETMGNATTICSDKTGTLTTNRMTVVEAYFCEKHYKDELPVVTDFSDEFMDILCSNIVINKAIESNVVPAKFPGGLPTQTGNKTDCALIGMLISLGKDLQACRSVYDGDKTLKIFPFNSSKKLMVAVVKHTRNDGEEVARVFVKGAPEFLLSYCDNIITNSHGNVTKAITQNVKDNVRKVIGQMATASLRTIALAYKDMPISEINLEDSDYFLESLTAIGLVGIEDPVRDEVPTAIKICKKAGVNIKMVTGDNLITARAIALKCGIYEHGSNGLVLDSKRFNRLIRDPSGKVCQQKLDKVWPRLKVLARSTPQDKFVLVNGIIESVKKRNREVVAVTGDGTNDAPALKKAHVGFAMGISGTDVAKEASDIIITDDNFASIVKALMWGRNVYDAISKFLQFQLTVNIVAILISILSTIIYGNNMLKAIQLLWVNLIMDSLASLALATDEPTINLLKRPPYGRDKSLISSKMFRFVSMHSVYQIAVLLLFMFAIPSFFHIPNGFLMVTKEREINQHLTMCFNVFVIMQIFNEINARRVHGERNVFRGIWYNKIFLGVIIVTMVVQVLIVQFSNIVFQVTPLDAEMWLWCLFFGFGELFWHQLIILLPPFKLIKKCKPNEVLTPETIFEEDDELEVTPRMLWIRGVERLIQQLKVVRAFTAANYKILHSEGRTSELSVKPDVANKQYFADFSADPTTNKQWSMDCVDQ